MLEGQAKALSMREII